MTNPPMARRSNPRLAPVPATFSALGSRPVPAVQRKPQLLLQEGLARFGAVQFIKAYRASRLSDCIAQACPLAIAYADTLTFG